MSVRFLKAVLLAALLTTSSLALAKPKIDIDDTAHQPDSHGLERVGDLGKFHFFGYGELHYNGKIGPSPNEVDFHRLVLGFGYDFTDKINFRAEVDFEHAFTAPELEYAYVDFLTHRKANIRAGAILVPMGVINQHHEPPIFNGVERPDLYKVIIPTTWQEAGVGLHGHLTDGLGYELYIMSALSAAELTSAGAIDSSFTGSNGVRGGRGKIASAPGSDFAIAGRLQYTGVPSLRLGTSGYVGNTGQGKSAIDGGLLVMVEADAKYSFKGFDLEGTVAFNSLSKAGNINNFLVAADATFTNFVASQMLGWNVEAAFHPFHYFLPDSKHDLIVFARYEDIDTQFKMPSGFAGAGTNDRNILTVGASYLPIPQVAIKADYQTKWNKSNGGVDQVNVGIGFYY